MIYRITERLVLDTNIGFEVDLGRCIELVNKGQGVAVGTKDEAYQVLSGLGLTDASISIMFAHAVPIQEDDLYALPR